MTLQNLLAIQRLQAHVADSAAVLKLLDAARRNLADARVDAIGADNRFDAAYKCVMQCAMLGLWANGYRTATSQPGHRNINDYVGDPISDAALTACIDEADKLLAHTRHWLREHHSELLVGA